MDECDVTPIGAYPGAHRVTVLYLTAEGHIEHGLELLAELLNYPAATPPDASLLRLLDPEGAELVLPVLRRALAGELLSCTVRLRTGAGSFVAYELTWLPRQPTQPGAGLSVVLRPAAEAEAADAAVREREKQLSIIFDSITDLIFVLRVEDDRFFFQFVNRAFLDVTGLRAEQIIDKEVRAVARPEYGADIIGRFRQAARGHVVRWTEVNEYATGDFVGEVCLTPVLNSQQQVCQLVGVVHDHTEQQQAEDALRDSNERFRFALKATTDALYDWDVAADTLFWGEGFEELFGYRLATNPTPFSQWSAYVHPDDVGRTVDDLRYVAEHTRRHHWQQEYRFQRADGSWAMVFDRGYLLRDATGRAVRMIGAMQDVTERKLAEERQQQLAQELVQHNADLQQFTYLVSHNLRAPLANATGFASLLHRLAPGTPEFGETLTHLDTSLHRVDEILHDLNNILAVRGRPLLPEPEPVVLAEVLADVLQLLAPDLAACGGEVSADLPPDLRLPGRRAYFHSIFYNLLTNALKYRRPDHPLRVQVRGHDDGAGTVTIRVADNGSGFDARRFGQEAFQLYKRFHHAVPGRGVGLFLVRAHAESMGGRVSVESSPGQGTTFSLLFPQPAP